MMHGVASGTKSAIFWKAAHISLSRASQGTSQFLLLRWSGDWAKRKDAQRRKDLVKTIVAGRKNDRALSRSPQRPKERRAHGKDKEASFRLSHDPRLERRYSNAEPTVPARPDQAVGQVIAAKANFMRVLVTSPAGSNSISDTREQTDSNSQAGSLSPEIIERHGKHQKEQETTEVELLCVVRALLKKIRRRVLVGDRVTVSGVDWTEGRGMIEDVLPRDSEILDPPIANVDHMLLVFAIKRPEPQPTNLSRFLVSAEATGVPFTLVFNKCDLASPEEQAFWVTHMRAWGYDPVLCSVQEDKGTDELAKRLAGRVSVLVGPSGVGKSSLINALRREGEGVAVLPSEDEVSSGTAPLDEQCLGTDGRAEPAKLVDRHERAEQEGVDGAEDREEEEEEEGEVKGRFGGSGASSSLDALGALKVGDVSAKTGRGRHTTRHVQLLRISWRGADREGEVEADEAREGGGSVRGGSGRSEVGGGLLADTPGFSQPTLGDVSSPVQLGALFPEIRERLAGRMIGDVGACEFDINNSESASHNDDSEGGSSNGFSSRATDTSSNSDSGSTALARSCAFVDCLHLGEPGCAVGTDWERHPLYVSLVEEVKQREALQLKMGGNKREGAMRYKSKGAGVNAAEPLLELKKHRRGSRKKTKQSMVEEMRRDEEEDEAEELERV